MTEEEAKGEKCPYGAVEKSIYVSAAILKATTTKDVQEVDELIDTKTQKCVASDCMMWREHMYSGVGGIDTGYCGLGGKP